MTVPTTQLCRVTVFGPSRRADLAVPVTTTVATLLPVLLGHVARDEDVSEEQARGGSWVLQRLGEEPMPMDGTPETLDWLDGEQLHLSPAENPLPELDFDDIAEGMATVVGNGEHRWSQLWGRRAFLVLACVVLGTAAVVLLQDRAGFGATISAGVLAAGLLVAAVMVCRLREDRTLAALAAVAGCGFAALAGGVGTVGTVRALELDSVGVLFAGLSAFGAAVALLSLQRTRFGAGLPIAPLGVVGVVALCAVAAMVLSLDAGLPAERIAALLAAVALIVLVVAPKVATRGARLRGPQLPRTAEELRIDIEPEPAGPLATRVGIAAAYLTMLTVGCAIVAAATIPWLLAPGTWVTTGLAGLFVGLILLRAREFSQVVQRSALMLSGAAGGVAWVLPLTAPAAPQWRGLAVLGLAGLAVTLVAAGLRPAHRRLLPIWGHLANVAELLGALAVLPLLLQLLGVFAWARGLAG